MTRDLRHDHDQLRAMMRHFDAVMAQGPQAFDATLHRDRVAFSQLFRTHMADEEAQALAALKNDPVRKAGATELHQLFRDYSAHIRAWNPARIAFDWSGYRAAVLALQARLLARMDWEEREIHPRLPQRRFAA